MRCAVLGTISVNGSVPGSPLERRIMAALLVDRGVPVSVDRLTDIVWQGAPPRTADNALQSKISRLRGSFEPGSLTRVGLGYVLQLAVDAVDADRFDDLVTSAGPLDAPDRLDVLDDALALWRGRAFGEFADEDFARPAAVGLEERRLTAHERRVATLLELGRIDDVIGVADELIDEAPFRESFWIARMRALAASGRTVEALRTARRARERFIDETGVPPSAAISAVEQEIIARIDDDELAPEHRIESVDVSGAEVPIVELTPTTLSSRPLVELQPHVDLVGHRAHRIAVTAAIRAGLSGSPAVVCVEGDIGVGKTRILSEAVATARADGRRVLSARGLPDLQLPFGAVGQLMSAVGIRRPIGASIGDDGGVGSFHRAEHGNAAAAGLRLVDALVSEPTVVVIDDAHLLDTASSAALELVVAELEARATTEPVPVAMVIGFRSIDEATPTGDVLHRMRRHPVAVVRTIGPLDVGGVSELVRLRCGVRPSGSLTDRLIELSGGVPLLVNASLDTWFRRGLLTIRAGCLDVDGDADGPRAGEVDTGLEERWHRLSDAAQRTLLALSSSPLIALVAPPVLIAVVAEATDLDRGRVADALSELRTAHFIEGQRQLRLAPPHVVRFVTGIAPAEQRGTVAIGLADAVLSARVLPRDETIAESFPAVAVHALTSAESFGRVVDEIVEWAVSAGESAYAVGDWTAAAGHLALALERGGASIRLGDGTAIGFALAVSTFRAHDEARAQALLLDAAAAAEQLHDHRTEGLARTLVFRSAISFTGSTDLPAGVDRARRSLESFVERARADAPEIAAHACAVMAEESALRDRMDDAVAMVDEARRLTGPTPAVEFAAGLTELARLELPAARRRFDDSARLASESADRWSATWGLGRLGLVAVLAGDLTQAQHDVARARTAQHSVRSWSELALSAAIGAAIASAEGRADDAVARAEEARLLSTRAGYPHGLYISLPAALTAHLQNGDEAGARAELDRLRSLGAGRPWPQEILIDLVVGETARAREAACHRLQRLPSRPTLNKLAPIAAVAAAYGRGDDGSSPGAVTSVLEWLHDRGIRRVPGWPTLTLAPVAHEIRLLPESAAHVVVT